MYSIIEYSKTESKPRHNSASGMVRRARHGKNLSMNETWRERAKRAMKGHISQETLAERLGISQPGLSHWLNGRASPTLDEINRIADEIGVSRVWLTHGLGPKEGPGKTLVELLLSHSLNDTDLAALAMMAETLLNARQLPAQPADSNPKLTPDEPLRRPGRLAKKLTGS